MNANFIGTTVGLRAWRGRHPEKAVSVEQYQLTDGAIALQPVSGQNLASLGGRTIVSKREWEDRPIEQVELAKWALGKCGWDVIGRDGLSLSRPGIEFEEGFEDEYE